jgi:hypothetical protein
VIPRCRAAALPSSRTAMRRDAVQPRRRAAEQQCRRAAVPLNGRAAVQPCRRAAELPSSRAAVQPCCRTAVQLYDHYHRRGARARIQPYRRAAALSETAALPSSRAAEQPRCRATVLPSSRAAEQPRCRGTAGTSGVLVGTAFQRPRRRLWTRSQFELRSGSSSCLGGLADKSVASAGVSGRAASSSCTQPPAVTT